MSDDATELDALFEEVAAQCGRTVATVAPDARELEAAPEPEPAPPAGTVVPAPDVPMFDCLGGIVRQLHDALRELGYDRAIAEIVDQVSDSQNRLEYMAALTEQAANKVLKSWGRPEAWFMPALVFGSRPTFAAPCRATRSLYFWLDSALIGVV